MANRLKEIEVQAMQLSAVERQELIDRLTASVDEMPLNDVDQAWLDEADRRYEQYKRGEVEAIDGERIFEDIRRELGWSK